MKRVLLCLVVTLCAVSFVQADLAVLSLQQTLKNQGFYYGAVTGDKSAETTAAIRRYQIRNGLQVTGELNEETSRSVKSSSTSVAALSRATPKPPPSQATSDHSVNTARVTQSLPPLSFNQPDRPLQTNPSYAAS